MQENLKYIIEVYNASSEIEKLIIKDSLNDLYLGVRKFEKIEKQNPNLNSIYAKQLMQNSINQMREDFTDKEIGKIATYTKDMLENAKDDFSHFGLFNLTKEKIIFSRTQTGQEIRNYYGSIGAEELEEIHSIRELFIENLKVQKIIGDFEIKDPIFFEAIKDFIEMTSKKGKRGRREMKDVSEMTDKFTRTQFSLARKWVGNEKLKKSYSYFLNDMNLAGYSFNLVDIELLYEEILQKKIAKPVSEMASIGDTIFIKYNGDEIAFEKGAKPYIILSWLYHSDYNGELGLMDIFPKLFGEEYSASKHSKEKQQIQNSVDGINRRFRGISEENNLVQFKDNTITKRI